MTFTAPLAISQYLNSISHQGSNLAFLKLDANSHVIECGSNLTYFDVTYFDEDTSIEQQVPALSGLLPVIGAPVIIANTQIDSEHFIDLHIYAYQGNQWVLLLDSTETGTQLQIEQQIRLSKDIVNEKKPD